MERFGLNGWGIGGENWEGGLSVYKKGLQLQANWKSATIF
jgi:hypothetical protein